MNKNLQCVGVMTENMEATATDEHTRLLSSNLADDLGLRLEELTRGLVVFLSVILHTSHIRAIELGKVIAPQRIAGFDLLYGLLYNIIFTGHLVQYLLVQQLHVEPTSQLGPNLVSTSAELSADGDDKMFLPIHKRIDLVGF